MKQVIMEVNYTNGWYVKFETTVLQENEAKLIDAHNQTGMKYVAMGVYKDYNVYSVAI